jgi:fumarylacetoacetate (FAA) hydrolase
MKLATLKTGTRDGALAVVDAHLTKAVRAEAVAATMQGALDDWANAAPRLEALYDALNSGDVPGTFQFDQTKMHSPLPRAFQWCEASVYLVHLERCRRATNRELPKSLYTEIAMYQGGSDNFIGPHDPILVWSEDWDVDYEAGICVVTDDVPMGVSEENAARHIKLVVLTNDVSLRRLQPAEMAKGLGVLQCKPANSFTPVAVTPESLGSSWTGTMLCRPIHSYVNDKLMGCPEGHVDAQFEFPALIAHLARTRDIAAGSIIGVGTVANRDESKGTSCLLERRALEILATGEATTSYLRYGDRVRIECLDDGGQSIFGSIDQVVSPAVAR